VNAATVLSGLLTAAVLTALYWHRRAVHAEAELRSARIARDDAKAETKAATGALTVQRASIQELSEAVADQMNRRLAAEYRRDGWDR
jgi:hypothetical protein